MNAIVTDVPGMVAALRRNCAPGVPAVSIMSWVPSQAVGGDAGVGQARAGDGERGEAVAVGQLDG